MYNQIRIIYLSIYIYILILFTILFQKILKVNIILINYIQGIYIYIYISSIFFSRIRRLMLYTSSLNKIISYMPNELLQYF